MFVHNSVSDQKYGSTFSILRKEMSCSYVYSFQWISLLALAAQNMLKLYIYEVTTYVDYTFFSSTSYLCWRCKRDINWHGICTGFIESYVCIMDLSTNVYINISL